MDSAKLKKLQDYSVILTQQAESKEAQGNKNEAVKDYVKLVDVLLVLANEAKDHPTWQQLISRAEFYQKKARTMVDPDQAKSSNPYESKQLEKPSISETNEKPVIESSSSFNPFRRLSLMGRKPDAKSSLENGTSASGASTSVISSWARDLEAKPFPTNALHATSIQMPENETVPRALYSQVLEEKTALQKQVDSLRNREKEFLLTLEEKEREFAERISQMVPRSQFEELRAKLADSVPRYEYDQTLQISRAILDDLAEYGSFLASTVSPIGDEKTLAELSQQEEEEGDAYA